MKCGGPWLLVPKIGCRNRSYTLHDDKPHAFVFSHLILASKFSMPPTCHAMKGNYATYEFTQVVIEVISEALEDVKLLD
jgi:hypothetical protein